MTGRAEDPAVVVLKTSSYPFHSGTIGVARSMGRVGVDVHVFGEEPGSPVARSRYVRSVRPLPREDPGATDLVRWLLDEAPPGLPLLVPLDDVGAILVSDWAEQLQQKYRFPTLPTGLATAVCDKDGLARLAVEAGVPTPVSSAPGSEEELDAVIATLTFPVVVKARDPRLLRVTEGVRSVEIAREADELRALWRRHLVDGHPNCIVQEYVPGGPETVWMVNAYVDADSRMHLAVSARKVRQRPPYTGTTTLGITERNEEVLALTEQLVRAIGYRGVLDIGWRFDARDGRYKVLDLNPRVGATFRLFAAPSGADVVRALYADLTGGPLPAETIPDGRQWLSEFHDLGVARTYIRDGVVTLRGYLRSLRGVTELVWWAAEDMKPARTALGLAVREWRALRPRRGLRNATEFAQDRHG